MPSLTCASKSAVRAHASQIKLLWVAAAWCLCLLGCSSSHDHRAGLGLGDGGPSLSLPAAGACDTPNQGCDCQTAGEVVDCGRVERVSGQYVSCSMGRRSCDNGKWGTCVGDRVATLSLPVGQRRTAGLGSGMTCPDNPCDPYCRVVVDSPADLELPDGGPFTDDGGLQVVPRLEAAGAGLCTSMVIEPTPQTLTVTGFGGAGLKGEYFNRIDRASTQISSSWLPDATRTDANIDFDWDHVPLPARISGSYSIRWTGSLVAPTSTAYTFCTRTDDGSRLWIDGNLVIDSWFDRAAYEACGAPITLAAGSNHAIRFEFYQAGGFSSSQLRWHTSTIADQVVPASAFHSGQFPIVSGSAKFTAEVSPQSCVPGAPQPAWTLDRLDIATIDASGQVGLMGGIAGPINVTAYLGQLSTTGIVNVKTDIADTALAPSGSVAAFQTAANGVDNARILYPYDNTVLPIGLPAPRVQWDNTASAAGAVKIGLRFPATGAAIFSWSQIIAEANPPQAIVPAEIWKYFEQTAKGRSGALSVQRIVGGQARQPLSRTLSFSSAPVRGKIFYTQYHRLSATDSSATEMVVDPGAANPAQPAFGATSDGCPVCHSLSATGNVFATSSNTGYEGGDLAANLQTYSSTLGGISAVNGNGSLTPLADFVADPPRANYVGSTAQDWRGFAWAPLTPDGKYALVANNVWGNTEQTLVGIDGSTRQVNTGSPMLSGGSGTGLLAEYYGTTDASFATVVWKRIEPQLNFDFGASSPGGLVPIDFSVRRSAQIQAPFTQTYRFEVVTTSNDSFSLSVGGTAVSGSGPTTLVADVPMTAGAFVPFVLTQINASGVSNAQLYWSSPSTPRALVPQTQLFPPLGEAMHGANVVYHDATTLADVALIEPDIASSWSGHNPAPGMASLAWRGTWDARVESPFSGPVQLCVDADAGVALYVDGSGSALIDSPTAVDLCAAAQIWTLGAQHSVHIVHQVVTANGHLILKYRYGTLASAEIIPSANLYPASPPPTTSGLTATYYDAARFNQTLPANQSSPRALQRVDPNIDFDWRGGRPNYSVISDDHQFSARWTGQILLPCAGVYEFRSNGDIDGGGNLWIDDARVMGRSNAGPLIGAGSFEMGSHDFKFDWFAGTLGASARLQWKTPCPGSAGWVTISSGSFTTNPGYSRSTGSVVAGGDNGNGTSYWVWQMPTAAGAAPVDVTGSSAGNWGLEGSAMMVPSFAPDGSKLVFIDGDSAAGAGWRKGLSTWDFDEDRMLFTNRRLVTSTWPQGDVLKWPTFESDSRSVIYQSTVPGDACCRNPGRSKYGFMGPTNYAEDPGRLWSVDTQAATPAPVELSQLNSGERALDANKSYQPTMLPVAAGGYRWVVFTSTRPYGNVLNLPGVQQDFSDSTQYAGSSYAALTNSSDIQSQLWVAAVDDAPSATADRSHPAFWLPSQNFSTNAASGYANERGYWALDACTPAGTTATSNCEVDEDCCGATSQPKSGACRLDTPLTNPPSRHCQTLPGAGQCAAEQQSCATASDCCTGLFCLNAACQVPPPVLAFEPANYERIYQSDCPVGTKVVWRFFDWQTVTPGTASRLEFYAETATDPSLFSTLPEAPTPVMADGVVLVGTASGAPVTDFTGNEVDALLGADSLKSQLYLKVTVRFEPNMERTASPILTNWRQSYSCVPSE